MTTQRLANATKHATDHATGTPLHLVEKRAENGAETAERRVNLPTQSLAQRPCHWCGEPFTPVKRDSQKFCTPSAEKSQAWKRKQALAGALARQFFRMGLTFRTDRLRVAQRCIEVEYERIFTLLVRLGWRYDVEAKVWLLASEWRKS